MLFFGGQGDYIAIAVDDFFIVIADVREHAATAILESALGILKIAAAVFSQRVERAVAEKAVEIIRVIGLMTGKEFTFFM